MTDRRPLLRSIFDAAVARAHPDRVLGAAPAAAARWPHHLSRRGQGRSRAGGCGGAALSRHARPAGGAPVRTCDDASRPQPRDPADRGDRSRASGSRCGEPARGGAIAATGARRHRGRPRAGAALRRRLGQLDRARGRRFAAAEAGYEPRPAPLRRVDRRDEHRAQTPLAHQGRAPRARGAPGGGADAGDFRRAA